jgi:tRNA-modifying protein YgfZ
MATSDALRTEYETLIAGCGLVDRSERGKLALTGAGAVEFLNGQVTNELADVRPGEGRYAAFLTHKGKMLGDVRILAVGETQEAVATASTGAASSNPDGPVTGLLLDTERVALQALFDAIHRYKIGFDVELHKRTLECGLFSLVGPDARACVARARRDAGGRLDASAPSHPAAPTSADSHTPDLRGAHALETPFGAVDDRAHDPLPVAEHSHVLERLGGVTARLIATVEGIDVLCAADDIDTVRTALLDADAGLVGEAAAEIVRVEQGRPRYGVEIDTSVIPQEADLNERAVSFTKGCYVGQETVARLYYKGKPNRHLRGLRFAPPGEVPLAAPPARGEELRLGERVVGRLGSVVESPRLGTIGLALVRREASPGDMLSVGERGAKAELIELPFPA